jgi:RimJ/RimL family protein N-acetyltransferase
MTQPTTLETENLILRPLALSDAPEVQRLAGDAAIASTTLNVPHPYEDGMAEAWITSSQQKIADGTLVNFAIARKTDSRLVGCISLIDIDPSHCHAELGYWVGKPYWNNGYCTEAVRAMIRYGFEDLRLNRICAWHFTRNPASGRVMQKAGMLYEGRQRQHVRKWDAFEDLEMYGILRSDLQVR